MLDQTLSSIIKSAPRCLMRTCPEVRAGHLALDDTLRRLLSILLPLASRRFVSTVNLQVLDSDPEEGL